MGYPWSTGDELLAADLNSAIANASTGGVPCLPLAGGVLTGPLRVPNGTLAAPSIQVGAADGTGMSRSANTLLLGAQGSPALALFANTSQFYGQLVMLGNRITQVGDAVSA